MTAADAEKQPTPPPTPSALLERRRAKKPFIPHLCPVPINIEVFKDVKLTKHTQPPPMPRAPQLPNELERSLARPRRKAALELHPETPHEELPRAWSNRFHIRVPTQDEVHDFSQHLLRSCDLKNPPPNPEPAQPYPLIHPLRPQPEVPPAPVEPVPTVQPSLQISERSWRFYDGIRKRDRDAGRLPTGHIRETKPKDRYVYTPGDAANPAPTHCAPLPPTPHWFTDEEKITTVATVLDSDDSSCGAHTDETNWKVTKRQEGRASIAAYKAVHDRYCPDCMLPPRAAYLPLKLQEKCEVPPPPPPKVSACPVHGGFACFHRGLSGYAEAQLQYRIRDYSFVYGVNPAPVVYPVRVDPPAWEVRAQDVTPAPLPTGHYQAGSSTWASGSSRILPTVPFPEPEYPPRPPRDVRSPRPDYAPRFVGSLNAQLRSLSPPSHVASRPYSPFPPQHTPGTFHSFQSQSSPLHPWQNTELWYPGDWENSTVRTGRPSETNTPEYRPMSPPRVEYAQYTSSRADHDRYGEESFWAGAPAYPSPPPPHTDLWADSLQAPTYHACSPPRAEYLSPRYMSRYSDRDRSRSASPQRRRRPPPVDSWAQHAATQLEYSPQYPGQSYQTRQYAPEFHAPGPRSPRGRVEYPSPGYRTPISRHADRGRRWAVSVSRRPHAFSPPPPPPLQAHQYALQYHAPLSPHDDRIEYPSPEYRMPTPHHAGRRRRWDVSPPRRSHAFSPPPLLPSLQAHQYAPQYDAPRSPCVERMEYRSLGYSPLTPRHPLDRTRQRSVSPPRRPQYPSDSPVAGPSRGLFREYDLANVEVPRPPLPFYIQRHISDDYPTMRPPTPRDQNYSASWNMLPSEQVAQNIRLEDTYSRNRRSSLDYYRASNVYGQALQHSSEYRDERYEADCPVSRKRGRDEEAGSEFEGRGTKRTRGSPRGDSTFSPVYQWR